MRAGGRKGGGECKGLLPRGQAQYCKAFSVLLGALHGSVGSLAGRVWYPRVCKLLLEHVGIGYDTHTRSLFDVSCTNLRAFCSFLSLHHTHTHTHCLFLLWFVVALPCEWVAVLLLCWLSLHVHVLPLPSPPPPKSRWPISLHCTPTLAHLPSLVLALPPLRSSGSGR